MNPTSDLPTSSLVSADLRELLETVSRTAATEIAPHAEKVDAECYWPMHSFEALARAGVLGLHVPRHCGGHEEGLLALVLVCEAIGKHCAASAICFGMHSVASAVIAAKATSHQDESYLRRIAAGEHLTTLALSEPGSGANFYYPETTLVDAGDRYVVNGRKHFVTNGSRVDSYVVSTVAADTASNPGEFNCVIVDADQPGVSWGKAWQGLGMRGNSSRPLLLDGVEVPHRNLLGHEGDQFWYVFEVVAPYFLLAMAGTYLGVADAALGEVITSVGLRTYTHSGERLAESPVLQSELAHLWTDVERTRCLIYQAAALGDAGDPKALVSILSAKAAAAHTAVRVTNEALTIGGGRAYGENGKLARLMRDARASHVMAPTTHQLEQWAGRSLLGLPLL